MPSEVRARMVEGAAMLLARHGVQATSFGEVLKATGAPRGSIYHHFPRGKDQLIEEAVELLGALAFDPIEQYAGGTAEEITREFLGIWRSFIGGFGDVGPGGGCAILAVTVTADSAQLVDHAAAVFRRWRTRLAELLHQGGLDPDDAEGFAATMLAAIEGATAFARAERSMAPYDLVSRQLLDQVRRLTSDPYP
jgi:TetR/AcrR family transcriptional regulator, lmrAB and yxaGH operons repressor